MNLTFKRLLIIFSVALNIGFVLTVAIILTHYPFNLRERHLAYAEKAIKSLDLSLDQENRMLNELQSFHQKLNETLYGVKATRLKILSVLSAPGPMDHKQFETAFGEIKSRQGQMRQLMRIHILTFRKQLGDKNGARYFEALKKQVESKKNKL